MLAVVFLLLDALAVGVDVGVARDAQHGRLLGNVVAKAAVEEGTHDVFDEGVAEGPGAGGQLYHTRLGGGHLDDAQDPSLGRTVERAGHKQAAVPQVGEGVAGVNDHGGDDGRKPRVEVL